MGLSRVATGAHYPGDVLAGFGLGAAIAVVGGKLVPPIVETQLPSTEPLVVDTPPRPDGAGVVLVVNPASGSGTGAEVIEEVREALPRAEIVELDADDDPVEVLKSAAERAEVLAVGGGDGTVSTAAAIAVEAKLPLAVFPAGTFNHFAKDIGCPTVADTVQAIRNGTVACVDLVCLNEEHMVINTASIGAYPCSSRPARSWNGAWARRSPGPTPCCTRCATASPYRSATTTRPCRRHCSSWAIRCICQRDSPRHDAPGWTTA